jgi:membrane protease YdiL (CAAX protease family)
MTTQQSNLGSTHEALPTVADVEQHSAARALVLALAPGVLLATAFYLTAPIAIRAGYPPIFAGVVCGAVIVVGGELGWLMREARRQSGAWSFTRVLPYRPGPFTWRKVLLIIGLFAWAFAVSVLGIGSSIKDEFFAWMPQWALNPLPESYADTGSTTAQVVTAVGYLVILVILAPLIEELYFRGYLLPRIGRFGAWAALINVSLFAFYHLWKPWDSINLIILLAPMVYAVWRTKDIRIGIAVHIMLNSLAWVLNVAPTLLLN